MPVDKVKVQHKFGIISHNHRQNLLERISAPATPVLTANKSPPCEISHDFILTYNNADPLDRAGLDVKASQLLQRVKRRAGLLSGGSGKHVHIPRSWVEFTLLARCKGPFREDVLNALFASVLSAPPSIDNIPSLFLVCETVIEWIKELGNPIPETAWSNSQILTYYISELCFWRVYNHALLHNLQGCDSFLSDLSWHIENLNFVRKVYSKYPDGELLLRHFESIKAVVSQIWDKKKSPEVQKKNFTSAGLMHGLDFYQCIKNGKDPGISLSSLLTTLSLLGTEGFLNSILVMKLLTIVCCKNFLSLQILQAAATGKLPMQRENSDVVGISETGIENWDWVIASEFINMLVYVALYGETSEIQRSAIQAGEMVSVRVDSAPVQGYGLLDLVHLNTQGVLGPAVQYALQQGLSRLYIHVKNDPLRKSGAHLIWKSLQKMGGCPGHRVIVGIGQNKTKCWESVKSQLGQNRKLLFEQMFDTLSEHYIPQSVSIATTASSKPRQTKGKSPTISEPDIVKPDIPVAPTASKISVVSSSTPGSVLLFMNSSKTFPAPSTESYCARNDRYLKDIVADQWYKELLSVFRATEKAHQSILECEELSEAEKNHAQEFVEELNLTESEVCNVMDSLVVGH